MGNGKHVHSTAGELEPYVAEPHFAQPAQQEDDGSVSSLNNSTGDALTKTIASMNEAMAATANLAAAAAGSHMTTRQDAEESLIGSRDAQDHGSHEVSYDAQNADSTLTTDYNAVMSQLASMDEAALEEHTAKFVADGEKNHDEKTNLILGTKEHQISSPADSPAFDSAKMKDETMPRREIGGDRSLYMTQEEVEESMNSSQRVPIGHLSRRQSAYREIQNQDPSITAPVTKAGSLFEFDSRDYDGLPSLDDFRSSKLEGFPFRPRDEVEYQERYQIRDLDPRQIKQKELRRRERERRELKEELERRERERRERERERRERERERRERERERRELEREARAALHLKWENHNKKESSKSKPGRDKLRHKIASGVNSSKKFVYDVSRWYLFRLGRKQPNRGVQKSKYKYGPTDDTFERTNNRRGTRVNHWGSDEDLVHDFGVRVPALQISQQISPIPKPANIKGERPEKRGEGATTSDWKFPVDRAVSGGEITLDEFDKQGPGEGKLSSKGEGQKISFFDVGGLLDDNEQPITDIEPEQRRGTNTPADLNLAVDGASEDASSYPLFCGICTSGKLTAPKLLSQFISRGAIGDIERAVNESFDLAATGQFEWILDLREAGYSNQDIVRSLMESDQSSPWNIPSSETNRTEFNDFMDPKSMSVETRPLKDFHQPQCVHKGPNHKLSSSESAYSGYQLHFDFSKIEAIRREVAELCGLAGLHPPRARGDAKGVFHGNDVRIHYGPYQLDEDGDEFCQLVDISAKICNAVRVLQMGGLCCDRITILAKLESGIVHMFHVSHDEIQAYRIALDALTPNFLRLWNVKIKKSGARIIAELEVCADFALTIMLSWMSPELKRQTRFPGHGGTGRTVTYKLHLCALFCQVLAVSLISYAQGHTGEFHPHYLKDSLKSIRLEGAANHPYPKLVAEFSYQKLACMGDLVGSEVLVLRMSFQSTEVEKGSLGSKSNPSTFVGSMEDIIDSWGPGVLISDSDAEVPYGEKIKSVLIGGGTIAAVSPGQGKELSSSLYHWGRSYEAPDIETTFNIRDELTIGAITTQPSCLLNSEMCRRASEPYLTTLGTDNDYWALAQRQVMLQGGQYVGLQVGNVYNKMKGRSLKTTMLDIWRMMPDFRMLLQPWGLQVSLCTGVARRVPLKTLIEEPMFAYIDGLSLDGWKDIKSDVRLAFNDTIDYISWTTGLEGTKRLCLIKVVTLFLEILNDTGVDREGKQLRMLWPHESSLCYAISLQCSKSNLWARVLKDSPSCATFAAVTSTCLEAPGHNCKRNTAPTWTGQGALLSTAVSRVLVPGALGGAGTSHWELKNGQQCWIEKAGGDIWVYTTKAPNSDTQLRVKINRFPKGLSIFRDWQVLRERQDATFEAEEVVVFGTMS